MGRAARMTTCKAVRATVVSCDMSTLTHKFPITQWTTLVGRMIDAASLNHQVIAWIGLFSVIEVDLKMASMERSLILRCLLSDSRFVTTSPARWHGAELRDEDISKAPCSRIACLVRPSLVLWASEASCARFGDSEAQPSFSSDALCVHYVQPKRAIEIIDAILITKTRA